MWNQLLVQATVLASYPIDWHIMAGTRVLTVLGLLITAHALWRAYPFGLTPAAHARGVAYVVIALCLIGGNLLTGQSREPAPAYQLGVNLGLWLLVAADAFQIGKRRFLNRTRYDKKRAS